MAAISTQFISFFSLYAAYAIVCFIVGSQLNKILFSSNSLTRIQQLFLNIVFGDALIITVYSLIKSRLITINITITILLVVMFIINKLVIKKKLDHQKQSANKLDFFILGCILVLPFIIRMVVYYNFSYHLPNVPHPDYQYYLTVSETLNQTGLENVFTSRAILFDKYHAVIPYRYHDVWLCSLFLENHSLSSIGVYNLIVSSFTNLLVLLGLLSIFELYRKVSIITILWTTLFLFTGYAYFFVGNSFVDSNTPIEYQKLEMAYAMLSAALIFYKKQMNFAAILSICILFVYGVTGLTMITGLGILIAMGSVFMKERKTYLLYTTLPIITIICFGVFYKLFGYKEAGIVFSLPTFKIFLYIVKNLIIKVFARYWYFYIWIILVLLFKRSVLKNLREEKKIFLLGLFFVIFCILMQALIINLGDANQFATCNTSPLLHILLYITVIFVFSDTSGSMVSNKTLVALMYLYFLYSPYIAYNGSQSYYNQKKRLTNYSHEYIDSVATVSTEIKNKLGLFWVDTIYYKNNNHMKEYFIRPGDYLKVMGNNFDLVNLSADQIPNSANETVQKIKEQNALMIYQKQNNNAALDIMHLKLNFLKEYKFEYLVLGKNAILPGYINDLITKKIYDNRSGETFCLLRKE